ncbi:hypothetical protein [Neptunomonas japonica]|uniref:hypothetical protein n=1 Tax=Neptunomonas japonica TaxID=417574 RepID=UPI0019163627|nr:hypothetical protein [Neptunomonas japonica]
MSSKKTSLLDAVSKFPYWVGFTIALLSWLYFHNKAGQILPAMNGGNAHVMFQQYLLTEVSKFLQYLAPGVFGLGGLISLLKQKKKF